MDDYHQYEPPSLAPLQITPAMMAQAQANSGEPRVPQPMPEHDGAEGVDSLSSMFPDYDRDVLASILATSGGVEEAIQQLLEMANPAPPPGRDERTDGAARDDEFGTGSYTSDEELAMALFKQFADDLERQLGRPIPSEVRSDPIRYEAFVREHLERELARSGSQLTSRTMQERASRLIHTSSPPPASRIPYTASRITHPASRWDDHASNSESPSPFTLRGREPRKAMGAATRSRHTRAEPPTAVAPAPLHARP